MAVELLVMYQTPSENNLDADWSAAETKKEERHPNELQIGKFKDDPNFCL